MIVRPASVAVVVLLALFAAACGDEEQPAAQAPTATATASAAPALAATETPSASPAPVSTPGKDCAKAEDFEAEPKRQPQDNVVETPGYFHVYKYENPPGKTERFYAVLDGTPGELASRRDDAMNFMVQNADYAPVANAFKEGVRATAKVESLDGKRTVDVLVTVLCAGKLRVRYTIS